MGEQLVASGCVFDISKRPRHLLAVVVPCGELQGWILWRCDLAGVWALQTVAGRDPGALSYLWEVGQLLQR